MESFRY